MDKMDKDKIKIEFGLEPTPKDPRDFSHDTVFGSLPQNTLPTQDFMISDKIFIKNQHASDFCTGEGLAAVSEDQEGVELSPEFAFAMIKRQRGEFTQYGGDLRSGCKVNVNVGIIEKKDAPFSLETKSRNFLANWKNWPLDKLLPLAAIHKKESFFKIDGPYDTFDNIRAALWQHRNEKCSTYTGLMWRSGWTYAKDGILRNVLSERSTGHCFKIFGQKTINGVLYLVIQNSAGAEVGNGGLFYVPRSIVNKEVRSYGAYMFHDMARIVAEGLIQQNKRYNSFWGLLREAIRLLFRQPQTQTT